LRGMMCRSFQYDKYVHQHNVKTYACCFTEWPSKAKSKRTACSTLIGAQTGACSLLCGPSQRGHAHRTTAVLKALRILRSKRDVQPPTAKPPPPFPLTPLAGLASLRAQDAHCKLTEFPSHAAHVREHSQHENMNVSDQPLSSDSGVSPTLSVHRFLLHQVSTGA
jgi:hypothetical protein